MSTEYKIRTEARRRRKEQLIRRVIIAALLVTCVVTLLCSILVRCSVEPKETREENTSLKESLQERQDYIDELAKQLDFYTEPTRYRAAEPTIYNIPLDEALQRYTYDRCVYYNVEEYYELMLALMWQESNYTPDAVSYTDDYGLMQINSINHEWLSEQLDIVDFLDPYQNIDAGVYLLAKLLHTYEDPHRALMCYAYGETGAKRHWARGNYTSPHSRSVMDKLNKIVSGQYYS